MDPITLTMLILSILVKLPDIIAAIKAIWEKIHNHVPLLQRPKAYAKLHRTLLECEHANSETAKEKLAALHLELDDLIPGEPAA